MQHLAIIEAIIFFYNVYQGCLLQNKATQPLFIKNKKKIASV